MGESVKELSLALSSTSHSNIEKLARDLNCSFIDVIRYSLALMNMAIEGKKRNYRIGFFKEPQRLLLKQIVLPKLETL